jgi:hypothetical protein
MYLSQAIVLLALLAAVMSLLEPVVKRGGSGGGFFSTCERIQVSGRSLLLAECKKTNREKNWSLLDLNHCLLNTGDALIAQREYVYILAIQVLLLPLIDLSAPL